MNPQIEFEWLRQWGVQGSQHKSLHQYWTRQMEQVEVWWNQLETRTVKTVEALEALAASPELAGGQPQNQVLRCFDVLSSQLVKRKEQREGWTRRLREKVRRPAT